MQFKALLLASLLGVGDVASAATLPLEARQSSKVPIDPNLYPVILRYTLFSSAAYQVDVASACPTPPDNSVFVQKLNNASTATSAALFRSDKRKLYILAFPGTDSAQDGITDINFVPVAYTSGGVTCTGCTVDGGFYSAYKSLEAQIRTALNKARTSNPGYQVALTGHSLGGALAGIAFPSLTNDGYNINATYTFGQPRVGNPQFANFVDRISRSTQTTIGNYYRTTHTSDPVPQLPERVMGFQHSRTEFFELDPASAANTYRCFGQEPSDCNNQAGSAVPGTFPNPLGAPSHLTYTGVTMGSQGCL